MAKDNGHTVLNPIQLAWAMVKGYVKQKNTTFKIDDVHQLLNTAIERVTPQNWQNFIKHVIEEENRIWKADDIMDEMIDAMEPCIMNITGETTSTDDSE
ncbi:DDE 3 domain-containing protein [Aphis craccivora]|uniref:DDE 3 domain-containing protein n=1 Tax=Aphis craccivora TaxID=307492 RepID=A0A6G0Z3C2_APHCR|nr:DDE 3 domain-containing protein [Aphis craccivora]